MHTGEHSRTEGRKCRACKQTEARCAYNYGSCCPQCSHWYGWSVDGEPGDARLDHTPVDELTAKRREMWRERYRARRAS